MNGDLVASIGLAAPMVIGVVYLVVTRLLRARAEH